MWTNKEEEEEKRDKAQRRKANNDIKITCLLLTENFRLFICSVIAFEQNAHLISEATYVWQCGWFSSSLEMWHEIIN